MIFFKYFTPVSYWILIILWLFIFIFYLRRIINKTIESQFLMTLLTILAIDAFRTLFESIYFGFWYTSLVGFIPKSIHNFLISPENVFLPKFFNVIAAFMIILILLRRWIPEEVAEREKEEKYTEKLENEIKERKKIEKKLIVSEKQLIEAQEIARVGHYIFNIKSGIWSSSSILNKIFGIDENYVKNIQGWRDIIHPDHQEMMSSYLENHILKEHSIFDMEYKIINLTNKEELWVHGMGHLKFDENGELDEMFGTIQDISEHKKMVNDLQEALSNVKVLSGLIPICAHCKKIRDDNGYWGKLEKYFEEHSDSTFSHGLCPDCAKDIYGNKKWFKEKKE